MTYKAPIRDMQFVMNELLDYPAHYETFPEGQNATPDMVDAILNEAAKFAENELAPLYRVGDEEGCGFDNGKITTPPGFKAAYEKYVEGGWSGLAQKEQYGGQGLPASLGQVVYETVASSNHAWAMYPSLTLGAIKTIQAHAATELQDRYIPKMVEGTWSGTMCLTEAHAGSDLGLLRTKAEPTDNGMYKISGQKVFISAGDHDLTENVIHIVLARLPDAPAGVGGISLFLVPKFKVNEDGTVGAANGVAAGSIEEKMGIHGNATCVMNFDEAEGYLISAPHKGMSAMFTFINESRLGVAIQSQSHIEASFQKSLEYAKDRIQMRAPVRANPEKPADPIITHPDVRRMLLTQKSLSEGGRVLNYYCAKLIDLTHADISEEERKRIDTLLAVLTPIAKGFISEGSIEATSHGVQIFGGHGFIKESGVEQHSRDTRINAIYEGTTGIQGLDLLGRKVLATGGKILEPLAQEITAFCAENEGNEYAGIVGAHLKQLGDLTKVIGTRAMENQDEVNAAGVDYLLYAGYTVFGWIWARSAIAAQKALDAGSSEEAFYKGKLATARFWFERMMPRTATLAITMQSGAANLTEIDIDAFAV